MQGQDHWITTYTFFKLCFLAQVPTHLSHLTCLGESSSEGRGVELAEMVDDGLPDKAQSRHDLGGEGTNADFKAGDV